MQEAPSESEKAKNQRELNAEREGPCASSGQWGRAAAGIIAAQAMGYPGHRRSPMSAAEMQDSDVIRLSQSGEGIEYILSLVPCTEGFLRSEFCFLTSLTLSSA